MKNCYKIKGVNLVIYGSIKDISNFNIHEREMCSIKGIKKYLYHSPILFHNILF